MGWTGTFDLYDRSAKGKREYLDKLATWESESRVNTIVKSTMIGSTYYAAVKTTYKDGSASETWALVIITSVNGDEFRYKDMSEIECPCYYDCPESILNLLTPTTDKYSLEWRKRCREEKEKNKKKRQLSAMPIGSHINYISPYDLADGTKEGDTVILQKQAFYRHGKQMTRWIGETGYAYKTSLIDVDTLRIGKTREEPIESPRKPVTEFTDEPMVYEQLCFTF